MRLLTHDRDIASLLTREARAGLSLSRQVVLYLDPFVFFMDATTGSAWNRARARAFNLAQRPILLTYARRWMLIAVAFFLGIAPAESLVPQAPLFIIPAAGCGIGCSISVAVAAWTAAAYLLLGTQAVRR